MTIQATGNHQSHASSESQGGPGLVPGGTKLSPSAPPAIQKWKAQIEEASAKTGLPANYIAATMWAESRGNPNDKSNNPEEKGRVDMGLMQISQQTAHEVGAGGLNVDNPGQNILAGAMELKDKFEKNGQNLERTSAAYVGHDTQQYVTDVMGFMRSLDEGHALRD